MPATTTSAAQALGVGEEPVDPGHADVGELLDARAVHPRRDRRLFGDGPGRGSRADHQHLALERLLRGRLDGDAARQRPVASLRQRREHRSGSLRRRARHQQSVVVLEHRARHVDELLGRLARAVDHFGMAAAQFAMSVEHRVAEIALREARELAQRFVDSDVSASYRLQQLFQSVRIQGRTRGGD
jgi:hypothetical protein